MIVKLYYKFYQCYGAELSGSVDVCRAGGQEVTGPILAGSGNIL